MRASNTATLLDPAPPCLYMFVLSLCVLQGWENTIKHNVHVFLSLSTTPPGRASPVNMKNVTKPQKLSIPSERAPMRQMLLDYFCVANVPGFTTTTAAVDVMPHWFYFACKTLKKKDPKHNDAQTRPFRMLEAQTACIFNCS